MESKTQFRVINGGLADTCFTSSRQFVSAYTTDTRLMGVVGIYIHWYLPQNTLLKHFHQFFYMDAEEFGFETYESILESDDGERYYDIKAIENRMMGGLGGHKVLISEREARYVIQSYAQLNLSMRIPLPGNTDEYRFLLSPAERLDSDEEYTLMCKQCPSLETPYQVINYFLMRCFGRDFGAAKFLTRGYVRTDIFPEHKAATLMYNSTEEAKDSDSGSNTNYYSTDYDSSFGTFNTRKAYMCQSLIEYDGKYYIIVTRITLDKLKIVKYEKISSFRVSPAEASMMTSRPEFITVFDPIEGELPDELVFSELISSAMVTEHESGRLFMIFYPHNDHVRKKDYRLSDDVLGIYYILNSGQVILCAYERKNIGLLEKDLLSSPMSPVLLPSAKYQFTEPMLYDFISSGSYDFEEFVELISDGDSDDE
ncbi:MAG: hypothetical protein ACI4U1_01945 [Anaerovoracaceae bacterium]